MVREGASHADRDAQFTHINSQVRAFQEAGQPVVSVDTKNWRGRPLVSHEVIVNLIEATRTEQGQRIRSAVDEGSYETGRKVTAREIEALHLERASFHGEWNYCRSPLMRNEFGGLRTQFYDSEK